MATHGQLVANMLINTVGWVKGLENARRRFSNFVGGVEKDTNSLRSRLRKLFAMAGGIGTVTYSVKLAADFESQLASFTTLTKNAEQAKSLLNDLQKFSDVTPFEPGPLQDSARSLLAFNIQSGELIPTLRRIGDVASGINEPIGEIAEIYGKAKVQGRLFMEDINQLTGRGINVIGELAKQFGVAESEVRELVSSGQVNFSHLEQSFKSLTDAGGQFAGGMAAKSKTIWGLWSTLTGSIKTKLKELGIAIAENVNFAKLLKMTTNVVRSLGWLVDVVGFAIRSFYAFRHVILAVALIIGSLHVLMTGLAVVLSVTLTVLSVFAIRILAIKAAQLAGIPVAAIWSALMGNFKGLAIAAAIGVGTIAGGLAVLESYLASSADQAMQFNEQTGDMADSAAKAAEEVERLKAQKLEDLQAEKAKQALKKYQSTVHELRKEIAILNGTATETGILLSELKSNGIGWRERYFLQDLIATRDELKKSAENSKEMRERIRSVVDEIRVLRGEVTETGIEFEKLQNQGVNPAELKRLAILHQQRDAIAEQVSEQRKQAEELKRIADQETSRRKQLAEQIREELKTPTDRFREQFQKLKELVSSGDLSSDLAGKKLEVLGKELMETEGKAKTPSPENRALTSVESRSTEFFKALAEAQKKDPQADAQKRHETILAAIKLGIERLVALEEKQKVAPQQKQAKIAIANLNGNGGAS